MSDPDACLPRRHTWTPSSRWCNCGALQIDPTATGLVVTVVDRSKLTPTGENEGQLPLLPDPAA